MSYHQSTAIAAEALARAQSGTSVHNDMIVIEAFALRGIPRSEIKPRENVLTLHAWNALGRRVKKGEHGVKLITFISTERDETDPATGATVTRRGRRMKGAAVFHISQTKEIEP